MSKLLRNFEFFLDLRQGLARMNHLRHFVSHHDEITLLLFEIGNAPTDVHRTMTGNIGLYGELARHYVIQDFDPTADV